ncbi:cache domain-containing protein [Massilia horti]|uniref:Cache domain-containing protein n=1 Tax=Massilia horti TaxID=2562153 RepID=A0A4Y9SZW0_9BURK|nr:cache domain-containing protein [Massilia horti]TFW30903.1 hypothetical protein E4O92_15300 [Massilia horti]
MTSPSSHATSRSLGAWLALAFVLLSMVLTLVLVEVVERAATAQLKTDIGHGLGELAMQTADKLDRGMFERYREVSLLAQRRDLIDPAADKIERRNILVGVQDTYGYYDWIGMADMEGRVQVAAHGLLEGADVSRRPWFQNALLGVYVGDVHEAKLLARVLPPPDVAPRRFVDIAFPYRDKDGKLLGVLGTHLSWQWAREVERSVVVPAAGRGKVEALIVDANGRVLLGPDGLQGTTLAQPSLRFAGERDNGYLVEDWPDGSYLVGFARTRGYGRYPGLGWTVLVRQNVDHAYLPVQQLRRQALWSGIGLALLFSLVGVVMARVLGGLAQRNPRETPPC